MKVLLVSNRGEVAVRVLRAASELGIRTVAVYSEDDSSAPHVFQADRAIPLRGIGPAAYLDMAQIAEAATGSGCDAVHPGYGFLSESAEFARLCLQGGMNWVGPRPEVLDALGDKVRARALAEQVGVPVLPGTRTPTTLEETRRFFAELGEGVMILLKAVAGGGGRGVRLVEHQDQLEDAFARAESEARAACGSGALYVERFLSGARHIEIQVAGDGSGRVLELGDRDCTLQRRYQKLVEIAPSPSLPDDLRQRLVSDAVRMAAAINYDSIGTFEFLVDPSNGYYAFIEANPRLQVEHTVTEEVLGVDLVQLQLRLADGNKLDKLETSVNRAPCGFAMQLRVNAERMQPDGTTRPSAGTIRLFDVPTGAGVRVDTSGYTGYTVNPRYDSLLAKLVVHAPSTDFAQLQRKASTALAAFHLEGVATNLAFLRALIEHPSFISQQLHTRFLDEVGPELAAADRTAPSPRYLSERPAPTLAGASVDQSDPLAVLAYGKSGGFEDVGYEPSIDWEGDGAPVRASIQGAVVSVDVTEGDTVRVGQQVLVLQAMKMEHIVSSDVAGSISRIVVNVGDTVSEGSILLIVQASGEGAVVGPDSERVDLEKIPASLAEAELYHQWTLDSARDEAVNRRHATGSRTARENIADMVDPGSFLEYGQLVVAAGVPGSDEEVLRKTPADGLVAGLATINGSLFPEERSRAIVMSYDYTVFAGTQGGQNHRKHDRMFELAEQWRLPIVFFTEGGGGRAAGMSLASEAPIRGMGGLRSTTFWRLGKLSGLVPLVGINSGRCFAGNAVVLGCCDVIIATKNSTIGIGGPAMIEGGGLGVFRPEEVGPMAVQARNGVVDIAVADEAEAVRVAKQYLSYFQGRVGAWDCADQRRLRALIPENRLRVYELRRIIETMADTGSWLELRRHFGRGMVTGLLRIEGRPAGIIANDPAHLGGAIDSDGADKAARFMQLCDAFDLPIISLCDTPGIMVGPESEKTAAVRHASRMIVTAGGVTVPIITVVLRKAYGLGALAMGGGSFQAPFFAVSWPTGEFGGMGFEGMVKLAFRDRLAAIEDLSERKTVFDRLVGEAYEHGRAVNSAMGFEIEDVIDPAETRRWIVAALRSVPPAALRGEKKRPNVDTW